MIASLRRCLREQVRLLPIVRVNFSSIPSVVAHPGDVTRPPLNGHLITEDDRRSGHNLRRVDPLHQNHDATDDRRSSTVRHI